MFWYDPTRLFTIAQPPHTTKSDMSEVAQYGHLHKIARIARSLKKEKGIQDAEVKVSQEHADSSKSAF